MIAFLLSRLLNVGCAMMTGNVIGYTEVADALASAKARCALVPLYSVPPAHVEQLTLILSSFSFAL